MPPILHRWTPRVSTSAVWHAIHQQSFCAIFEAGDWIVGALSSTSQWWYQGNDWSHLEPSTKDTGIDDGPPFLEGILTIISFDGLMHAWYADYSIALHKSSGQWYCWGTVEQMATIAEWCIEETPCLTTVDASSSQHSMTQSEYCTAVNQVREAIRNGNVYQINLAHQIGPFTITAPLNTWLKLNTNNPSKHGFFWKTPSEILLCNSPELFLNITAKGYIESLPIKGTHGDVSDPNSYRTLWESPKERAELTMIVDMMRNDISIVAEYGSVKANERQIRQCGDLLHAEQRVHGQIRDGISTLQAVHACFPPASVTGAPKESALNYIRDLESVQRNWYTGSFGFMDTRGHSTWNVIIRTVQGTPTEHSGMTAYLNIGAGIVYDSEPEAEWEETMAKGRAIERVLCR
jgi:anthranilate/para-aminobenzoate synthase component I